jgi:endonuclease YncB( thermonuclease family)
VFDYYSASDSCDCCHIHSTGIILAIAMGCCYSQGRKDNGPGMVMSNNPFGSSAYPSVEEMKAITLSSADCYVPKLTRGFVAKVYDGDSITILGYNEDISGSTKLYKYTIRLNGIDCPELRTKDEVEKLYGQRAQQRLSALILHTYVRIVVHKLEKYGRMLADVYVEDIAHLRGKEGLKCCRVAIDKTMSVSEWMVRNRYGVVYKGQTKPKFNTAALAKLDM